MAASKRLGPRRHIANQVAVQTLEEASTTCVTPRAAGVWSMSGVIHRSVPDRTVISVDHHAILKIYRLGAR